MSMKFNDENFYGQWNKFVKYLLEEAKMPSELKELSQKVGEKITSPDFKEKLLCELKSKEVAELIFGEINVLYELRKGFKEFKEVMDIILKSITNIVDNPVIKAILEIFQELIAMCKIIKSDNQN